MNLTKILILISLPAESQLQQRLPQIQFQKEAMHSSNQHLKQSKYDCPNFLFDQFIFPSKGPFFAIWCKWLIIGKEKLSLRSIITSIPLDTRIKRVFSSPTLIYRKRKIEFINQRWVNLAYFPLWPSWWLAYSSSRTWSRDRSSYWILFSFYFHHFTNNSTTTAIPHWMSWYADHKNIRS